MAPWSLIVLLTLTLCILSAFALSPEQHGTLRLAMHSGLVKIYDGSWLSGPELSWSSSVENITYVSDDEFCEPMVEGYDCACNTSDCTGKRCYQYDLDVFNADDDKLFFCTRISTNLLWRIPTARIGAPGNYHLSLLISDDKWHEFAQANNGRKFSVYIDNEWHGDFDLFGWTGGNNYAVLNSLVFIEWADYD